MMMNEDKPGHCGNCGFRLDVNDVFPNLVNKQEEVRSMGTTHNGRELGLNVDMLDVDFLRGLARIESPSTAARLHELADKLAQEVRDVGTLRSRLRDSYRVVYGPAMDHVDFPFTVSGFANAVDFAEDKPGSVICNPNASDLDNPTGFTAQEKHVEGLLR